MCYLQEKALICLLCKRVVGCAIFKRNTQVAFYVRALLNVLSKVENTQVAYFERVLLGVLSKVESTQVAYYIRVLLFVQ